MRPPRRPRSPSPRKAAAPVAPPPRRRPPWTSRDSVVAEWRRVNLVPLETAARSPAVPVGSLMPELLRRLGMPKRRAEAELVKAWNTLVDPTVAAHAQPAGVRNGTLFVKVDSSVWLSELVRYRRHELLERLQHCFGRELIARISFRLG